MIFFRSLLFKVIFSIVFVILSLVALVFLLLPRRFSIQYGWLWMGSFFRTLKYTVGLECVREGLENLPQGPYIMACKHQSLLETFMFPYHFAHPLVIMKKSLTRIPFWGWILARYDVIAIDRDKPKQAIKMILEKAEKADLSKRPLVIFPEGSRSMPGDKLPYQAGIAVIYDKLKVPVVPIAVNTGSFWSKGAFKYYPGKAVLRFLPPIEPGLSKQEFMKTLETIIETESLKLMEQAR